MRPLVCLITVWSAEAHELFNAFTLKGWADYRSQRIEKASQFNHDAFEYFLFQIASIGLLHKEVGRSAMSVVRILHSCWRLICIWICQVRRNVICVKVSMNRVKRKVNSASRLTIGSALRPASHRHRNSRISVATVAHWAFVVWPCVTASAVAAWALSSHGW